MTNPSDDQPGDQPAHRRPSGAQPGRPIPPPPSNGGADGDRFGQQPPRHAPMPRNAPSPPPPRQGGPVPRSTPPPPRSGRPPLNPPPGRPQGGGYPPRDLPPRTDLPPTGAMPQADRPRNVRRVPPATPMGRRPVPPANQPQAQRAAAAERRPVPPYVPAGSAQPPGLPPNTGGHALGGSDGEPPRPHKSHKVRNVLLSLVALGMVLPILGFLVAYVVVNVPESGDIRTNQVATILASDNTTVLSKVVPPEGNRTDVGIQQIPSHVRNAVLSAEDRDFYSNPGFSVSGFARAARDNVLGKDSAGGGSTITQQYVKNALVGNERSLTRKMKELVISTKMARQWSKDDILAAYLNTIYFGRGAYGIAAASKAYFDKPVERLSVAEGAVLAATIQQPSGLDPETNPKGAHERWDYVLDGMVDGGNLPAAERASMQYPPVAPANAVADPNQDGGPEGLIKAQVLRELQESGVSEQDLNTEGLQITTTIDPKAQNAAVDAVNNNLEGESPDLRTAVVSVDPKSGAVRAYYGGKDGKGFDFANSGLQTGSSFKVFGLAAGLEQGIPLSKMFDSSPLTVNGIEITNVEGEGCGTCTIAEALKRSLNTSFYRLQLALDNGPEAIADVAHRAGIPEDIPGVGPSLREPDGGPPNNGIVLGQYQSRPIDMASAYATLAASGEFHTPHFVQKVVTADGNVLLDRGNPPGEQRIDKAVADNVTSAMEPIAAYSNGHNLRGGRPSASKTGTAQLGDTGDNKDAWMVGFTPSLSTAVWVGTEQGLPLRNSYGGMIYGSGIPSDIWKATMDGALAGTDVEDFPDPEPIGGQAGVPQYTAPYVPPKAAQSQQPSPSSAAPSTPPSIVITPTPVEILPGITIPIPGIQQPNQQGQPPANGQQQGAQPGNGNGNGNGNGGGAGEPAQGGGAEPNAVAPREGAEGGAAPAVPGGAAPAVPGPR